MVTPSKTLDVEHDLIEGVRVDVHWDVEDDSLDVRCRDRESARFDCGKRVGNAQFVLLRDPEFIVRDDKHFVRGIVGAVDQNASDIWDDDRYWFDELHKAEYRPMEMAMFETTYTVRGTIPIGTPVNSAEYAYVGVGGVEIGGVEVMGPCVVSK